MLKKYGSILMMFIALAIMLGHNLIPHQHHDFEHYTVEHHDDHHHSKDHHHGDEGDGNSENEESDFGHLFSNFPHGESGISFLSNHFTNILSKQLSPSTATLAEIFVFQNSIEFVRQNSPPYNSQYSDLQYLLPCGLRAPPVSNI